MADFDDMSYYVLDIREKERERIARDLHDISLQDLAHLGHKLELASLYIDKDPVQAKLELAVIQQDLKNVIDEVRNVVYNLHPTSLDDLGLKDTLLSVLEKSNQENKFFVETDIDDILPEDKNVLVYIFRMAQECCNNAIKHSGGSRLLVSVKDQGDKYVLRVEDNGCGFSPENLDKTDNHFGLSIMKERVYLLGGTMRIDSSENGTKICIEIPKQMPKKAES